MDPRYGEMSEHRVSMLRSALRRGSRLKYEDPATSRDPRVRAVVEGLRAVDYAPAPSPHFRAELRAQLVAVAPRIIAESAPEDEHATAASSARTAHQTVDKLGAHARRRRFARPIAVTASMAAALLLLFGGAVWQSHKALPGDSLYGLKRAGENVQLALSSGGTDRGHDYLRLAGTRVNEAQALLHRDSASAAGRGTLAAGLSAHTARLIASNLASADSDLRHGSDLLNTQAVTARSQSPLAVLTRWAPSQLTRLQTLAAALPEGSLRDRARTSWTLTDSALARARSLAPAVDAGCASTASTDALGPVPTCAAGTPSSSTPTSRVAGSTPTPASSTNRTAAPSASSVGGQNTTTNRTLPTGRSKTPATSSGAGSGKIRLPTALPSKPVSVGSCGISVRVGPIGIGVGQCPSHS